LRCGAALVSCSLVVYGVAGVLIVSTGVLLVSVGWLLSMETEKSEKGRSALWISLAPDTCHAQIRIDHTSLSF
jgi:hypothetical protein